MSVLRLAFRNILRNKRRTILTLMSILVGVGGLVLFNGFIEYSLWGLRESTIRSGLGHLQIASDDKYFVSGAYDPFTFLLPREKEMVGLLSRQPGVKTVVPQVRFTATMSYEGRTGVVMISANDPAVASELYGFRSIVAGRELDPSDKTAIVLGRGVAEKLGVDVGGTITVLTATSGGGVNALDLDVVGICSLGSRDLENVTAYATLETAKELLVIEQSPLLVVLLDETAATDATHASLVSAFQSRKFGGVVKKWDELADYYRAARDLYANMLDVVQAIILLIVVFAIANTMMMAIMERTREIGTLRAMGTRDARVTAMFLVEATAIGAAGGLLGVGAGFGIAAIVNALGGIYIPPPPGRSEGYHALFTPDLWYSVKIWGLATVVAFVSAIYPSMRAARQRISECLRSV